MGSTFYAELHDVRARLNIDNQYILLLFSKKKIPSVAMLRHATQFLEGK